MLKIVSVIYASEIQAGDEILPLEIPQDDVKPFKVKFAKNISFMDNDVERTAVWVGIANNGIDEEYLIHETDQVLKYT